MFDFIKNISPTEIIIVVIIIVVLFGAKALTGLGRTSGKAVRELKNIKKDLTEAISDDDNDEPGKN